MFWKVVLVKFAQNESALTKELVYSKALSFVVLGSWNNLLSQRLKILEKYVYLKFFGPN